MFGFGAKKKFSPKNTKVVCPGCPPKEDVLLSIPTLNIGSAKLKNSTQVTTLKNSSTDKVHKKPHRGEQTTLF